MFQKESVAKDIVNDLMQCQSDTARAEKIGKLAVQLDEETNAKPTAKAPPRKKTKKKEADEDVELDLELGEEDPKSTSAHRKVNEDGEVFDDVLRQCSVEDLTEVIEATLCFYAVYKQTEPIRRWKTFHKAEKLQGAIRRLLALVRLYLPRKTGNGWKLQKYHTILHLVSDMEWYGLPANYNCGRGENFLQVVAKFASLTAQNRGPDTHTSQTADRLYEYECHSDALSDHGYEQYTIPKSPAKLKELAKKDDGPPKLQGSHCRVYTNDSKHPLWSGNEKRRKGYLEVHPAVLDFFRTYTEKRCEKRHDVFIQPTLEDEKEIGDEDHYYWEIYTECDIYLRDMFYRHTFRCHPNYRDDGPYFDWAFFKYVNEDGCSITKYPCKIIAFVANPKEQDGAPSALVHCTMERSLALEELSTTLITHWYLEYTNADRVPSKHEKVVRHASVLRLVDLKSLVVGCYVVEEPKALLEAEISHYTNLTPEEKKLKDKNSYKHVLVLLDRNYWAEKFWQQDDPLLPSDSSEDDYLSSEDTSEDESEDA
jgi:hypothetical protein